MSITFILIGIGFALIYLAIRFGLLRLIFKAGNMVDKKIVDYKNANHPAETIRLADLYPDFVATLKSNRQSIPVQPVPVNVTPVTQSQPIQIQQKAFPQDHCCICGASLERGYAVLLSNYQGEARIDENCCNGIAQMMRSQDKQQVYEAYNYFAGLYQQMQPAIAEHIANYLAAAENYLQTNS